MDENSMQFVGVISPEKLKLTFDQLDFVLGDLQEKGKVKEAAYGNRGALLQRKTQLDTEIQLAEAEAIMSIQGEGRNQFVVIDGDKVALTNDTARDAYRRRASQEQRRQLAEVEGELQQLDIAIAKANDAWYTTKETSEVVRAKGNVQASLLNYLAGR